MSGVWETLYMVAGVGAAAYLLLLVAKSQRRLERRIEQHRREMEDRQGAPLDPFAALAELYADDARANDEARQGKHRRS